jgi:hypothetical protein
MAVILNPLKPEEQQQTPAVTAPAVQTGVQAKAAPSSGRFTNIQQFLQANKQAGQQIGQAIGGGISTGLSKAKEKASTEAQQVGEAVRAAQGNVQQGQQFLEQMKGPAFNAESFVQNEPQLQQFTGLRTGEQQGKDLATLQKEQLESSQAAAMANQQLQQRQQQLGDISNRYGLLQEFVGKSPNYGLGAQRLDQTLFQRASGNVLGGLQKSLQQQKQTDFKSLLDNIATLQNQISGVKTSGQELAGGLQTQANVNEQALIDALTGKIGGVNEQRQAEQARYKEFFDILTSKKKDSTLDKELFEKFGLTNAERTYNVLNDPNLTLGQIANISNQMAQNYQDVAQQSDVDKYAALAKMAGIAPDRLRQAGNLEAAASIRTGEDSLRGRLDRAKQVFEERAGKTTITGTGSDTGSSGILGSGGTAESNVSKNVADFIKSGGMAGVSGVSAPTNLTSLLQFVNPAFMAPQVINATANIPIDAAASLPAAGTLAAGTIMQPLTNILNPTSVISGLGLTGNSGSMSAAQARAQNQMLSNMQDYLNRQGYYNYLTAGGPVSTNDLETALRTETIRQRDVGLNYGDIQDANAFKERQTAKILNPMIDPNSSSQVSGTVSRYENILKQNPNLTEQAVFNAVKAANTGNTDIVNDFTTRYGIEPMDMMKYINAKKEASNLYSTKKQELETQIGSSQQRQIDALNEINRRLGISQPNTEVSTMNPEVGQLLTREQLDSILRNRGAV